MTAQHAEDKEWDNTLRTACADDLPPEVAAGMARRIEEFRAATQETARGVRFHQARVVPQAVWAAVGALMLAAGILLQSLEFPNALAERISQIRTEIANGALSDL
mgnify:CR=1 FL=1